jgi:cytosine/adenosine deaminase-related metal-dependent hydrolase
MSETKLYTARWVVPISSEPIEDGGVVVEGTQLVAVGTRNDLRAAFANCLVEDFGDAAIIPGLVNCHSHLELTAMRGYLEDVENDFTAWLRKLTVARLTRMGDESLFISALAGAVEAIRAGITCVSDAGDSARTTLAAVKEAGLRSIVHQEVFGPDPALANEAFQGFVEKVELLAGNATEVARIGVSPHAPYSVSGKLFQMVTEMALSRRLPMMIHAAESEAEERFVRVGDGVFTEGLLQRSIEWRAPGMSSVQYLDDLGVLEARPILAHCIRVDDQDISILKKRDVGVAHCPKSNAKLGHGRAPFERFLKAGLRVGLGSDSVASNNNSDILEEARFATLLSRTAFDVSKAPRVEPAAALHAATLGGARAMRLETEIGSLEAGKQADIAVVSLAGVHQGPIYDVISSLIFSSSGRDVVKTIVAGVELFDGKRVLTIDEEPLSAELRNVGSSIVC